MRIPTQEQWQKVIDTLKSVLPLAKRSENFNMSYGIRQHEPCGTVCCVGGWYLVALTDRQNMPIFREDDWVQGKHAIANDLGFRNGDTLKQWADDNPGLWGNKNGLEMFMEERAYNSGVYGARATTLADVINHFEYVKNKCDAYTKQTAMANSD